MAKKWVSILTALCLIACMAVWAAGCGNNDSTKNSSAGSLESGSESNSESKSEKVDIKVDLNDYLVVSFYGIDGDGTAEYGFDSMAFVNDCSDIIAYKDSEPSSSAAMSLSEYLIDGGSFDVSAGLSNGDKVVFVWNLDEDTLADEYVMNFTYRDAEYTVENLLMSGLSESNESSDEEQVETGSESDEDNPMKQAQREALEANGTNEGAED